MSHKTAYQCLVCGGSLSHADSIVLSVPGTPKVLLHKGRCFSKYKGKVRYGGGAAYNPGSLPPRIAPIGAAPAPIVPVPAPLGAVPAPMPPVVSSKDDAPSTVVPGTVPVAGNAVVGDTSTANTSPIPEPTTRIHYTNTFSKRVHQYRIENKLTLLQLAKRVGYKNASTVCGIEKGNITRATERVYELGVLLGLLRHEVDTLLSTRERDFTVGTSDNAPRDSAPTSKTIHHYNEKIKTNKDNDLTTNFARCNDLPYQAAAEACKALVLHILRQEGMPDMVLVERLVAIGWGVKP